MSNPLAIVSSCDDCGACCRHVGTPPGFFGFYCNPDREAGRLEDTADFEIWLAMPEVARNELRAYYRDLWAGLIVDRVEAELPCLWYDPVTAQCRHYDSRPEVCRDFEVGGVDCLAHRQRLGVGR